MTFKFFYNNQFVFLQNFVWSQTSSLLGNGNVVSSFQGGGSLQSMTMSIGACCIVAWVVSCIGIIVGGFGIYFAIVHDYEADALEKSIPDYHSGYHPSHVHNYPGQQGGLVKKSVPSYYLLFFLKPKIMNF